MQLWISVFRTISPALCITHDHYSYQNYHNLFSFICSDRKKASIPMELAAATEQFACAQRYKALTTPTAQLALQFD